MTRLSLLQNAFLLVGVMILFQRAHAWVAIPTPKRQHVPERQQPQGDRGLAFVDMPTLTRRRTSESALFAFNWFGGDGDDVDESSEAVTSTASSLTSVANIMDSMASFKTSQQVGDRTASILQDLSNQMAEGTSVDGKVKVTYNGQQKPIGVQIDEAYFEAVSKRNGGLDELCRGLTQAMQEAQSKSAEKMEEKMKPLYEDIGLLNGDE